MASKSVFEAKEAEATKLDVQEFEQLKPEDVWKDFICPKYVSPVCPETDKLPKELLHIFEQLETDGNNTIQKLDKIISDPVTNSSVPRICRLLDKYLHEVTNNGYKVKDLPSVTKVLEFMAMNVRLEKEYEQYLDQMLDLCRLHPLLDKSSDNIVSYNIMERYFSLLGHLLLILHTKEQVLKIHRALHSLLLRESINIAAVKRAYCHKVIGKSLLPITVTEILNNSYSEMYPKILELVFLLSSVSHECSYRMIEAGILNTILIRMDLPYATQFHCMEPPDKLLRGHEYSDEITVLILNTIWSLFKSILPPKNQSIHTKINIKSVRCALWGICYAFKRHICYSQYNNNSAQFRNEIAMIILAIMITFPSWNIASTGIADEVIKLLVGTEIGSVRVFSKTVKFPKNNDSLLLQKVLLLIAIHLAQFDVFIHLMTKRELMKTVLQFVNPNIEDSKITWSSFQFWNLWTYAINALSILAPKMPKEFVKYDGTMRLSMILEWILNSSFDADIAMNLITTVSAIILNSDSFLLQHFREHGFTLLLIKFINHILMFKKITTKEERILTLTLMSIERLLKEEILYKEIYGEQSVRFIMELLFKCLYQKDTEIEVDQRLLLAIGSYIWECIVWCPSNLKKFAQYGGVHIILDIIEVIPYPSQCLFLGLFTDICDNIFCGHYLCTWRGINKKTGLMSLLATVWREEEIRIEVKRHADGTIKDKKGSQMGSKQWLGTFHDKVVEYISPAIVDLVGSVRSKVYSIRMIIERDSERYEFAKEKYKILYTDFPIEDQITMSCVDLYFKLKLGQIWLEISKYFEHIGVTPLGMDGQAIFLMIQRYYLWGELIQKKQDRLLQSAKTDEETQEKDEYARIRDSKLAIALDAFDELDYIYRTTDRTYMLKKKNKQRREVNSTLWFPPYADDDHCHRTFQDKPNSTAIFDQHPLIPGTLLLNSEFVQWKVPPVSPCYSYISDNTYSYESTCASLSSNRLKELVQITE